MVVIVIVIITVIICMYVYVYIHVYIYIYMFGLGVPFWGEPPATESSYLPVPHVAGFQTESGQTGSSQLLSLLLLFVLLL